MAQAPGTIDIGQLIYSDPNFRDGRHCIAGTGVSVIALAWRFRNGETVEEIADDRPDLPASHVHAAITYYLANRAWFDRVMDDEEAEEAALEADWLKTAPPIPG